MKLRFETRKMNGIKVEALVYGMKGYYMPQGYGVFDTQRNEFVIITDGALYDIYKKKSTTDLIVNMFNTVGATYGNDNLKTIKRYNN